MRLGDDLPDHGRAGALVSFAQCPDSGLIPATICFESW